MSSRIAIHRVSSLLSIAILLVGMAGCFGGGGGGRVLPPEVSIRGLKNLQYNSVVPVAIWVETQDAIEAALSVSFRIGTEGAYTPATPLPGLFNPTSLPWVEVPSGGGEFTFQWHAIADFQSGVKTSGVYVRAMIAMKDGTVDQAVFGPIEFDYTPFLGGTPPPYVEGGALPATSCGSYYDQQLDVEGGEPPFEWSIIPVGTHLPWFLELTYNGHIRGTIPPKYGPATVKFIAMVTDSNPVIQRESAGQFTLFVDCVPGPGCAAPPEILFTSIPEATEGEPYFFQCTADAGQGELEWSIISGDIPDGLHIDSSGLLSGTCPQGTANVYHFTIQVCDSCPDGEQCDTVLVTLVVIAQEIECDPGPTITTQTIPGTTEGIAYSRQLLAAGGHGELTWDLIDGTLPNGVVLTESGAVTGTPGPGTGGVTGETYIFTAQVCDSCPVEAQCDTQELSLIVAPDSAPCAAGPQIDTTAVDSATIGFAYNFQFQASGGEGALTWLLNNPNVISPTGLIWHTTGTLSGTPSTGSEGLYNLDITVKDSCSIGAQEDNGIFEFIIYPPCAAPPEFVTTTLPQGNEGLPYDFLFEATGGEGPLTWSQVDDFALSTIGLEFETDGRLHGTPTVGSMAGSPYSIEIKVQDSCQGGPQSVSNIFNLVIGQGCAAAPEITTTILPVAAIGMEYNYSLAVQGGEGTLTWEILTDADQLPNDLVFSDGTISGIPASGTEDTYNVHFQVCDSCPTPQCDDVTLALVVSPPCAAGPGITTADTPDATVDIPYELQFEATGGEGALQWDHLGSLPPSFLLTPEGLLSGTATALEIGDWQFDVVVADSCWSGAQTDSNNYTLTILPNGCMPPPDIISAATVQLPAGYAVNFRFTAQMGQGVLTWTLLGSDPPLPGTVDFSSTGFLRGTTDVSEFGTYLVDIEVCDECDDPGIQCDQMLDFQLVLDEATGCGAGPPVITDATIPTPTADGSPYSYTMNVTGGDGILLWDASGLPKGLMMDMIAGEIHGAVQAEDAGTYRVIVWVWDSCIPVPQADSAEYTWHIT